MEIEVRRAGSMSELVFLDRSAYDIVQQAKPNEEATPIAWHRLVAEMR